VSAGEDKDPERIVHHIKMAAVSNRLKAYVKIVFGT
jgi:hypothetical protein